MRKPRINQRSLPLLISLDQHIRDHDCRGTDLYGAPSDLFDGWAYRRELDDLIRRRLLCVLPTGNRRDERGTDMCGTTWTVHLTDRAIQAWWPNRATTTPLPRP